MPGGPRLALYGPDDLERLAPLARLPRDRLVQLRAVAAVIPFRVNSYVLDELIDWDAVPADPMFQLSFPQPGMLEPADLERMTALVRSRAPAAAVQQAAHEIQWQLNPHPAGQLELNIPHQDGQSLRGLQHKYRETVLLFPAQGQTCHAYCSYCFRWPQFTDMNEIKFSVRKTRTYVDYLARHPEVTSVLLTGGDPLIMSTAVLRRYVEPLLSDQLQHVTSIRIGTKTPAFWPQRFLTDDDADDLLRLFEETAASGRHLALMAHFSHPRELETPQAQQALRRIISAGAGVRCQAPMIRYVNDAPETWADLWNIEVRLGAAPYYLFVQRDTGARRYFEVPLARSLDIFRQAYTSVSGLSRTVRGPVMSATPGKVLLQGVAKVLGHDVFVLQLIQARNRDWVGRPFFAAFDVGATWLDQLRPAFGEQRFFFESGGAEEPGLPAGLPPDSAAAAAHPWVCREQPW